MVASAPDRLEFRQEPVMDRRSQRMGVHEGVFRLQPRQVGTFRPPQQLADAMVHGLRHALSDLLDDDTTIDDCNHIYTCLSSDPLDNAFDYRGLTAREWRQNGIRATEMLDHTARMLNSKEQFEMNDSFLLAFGHVRRAPVGMGRKKKYLPGHQSSQRFKEMRRSCISMPQDDAQLCAVCAIVTARVIHKAGSNQVEQHKWTDPQ